MIGRVVKGKYRIMDEVGQDLVSTIYLAKDTARKMLVTLRVINPERAAENQFREHFEQEVSCLKQLNSTQAIKVLDYGEDEGILFVAQEHVQGTALSDVLAEEEPLQVGRALDIARQVVLCLVDAHAKGVVHRQICPEHIILITERVVRVVGFSIAWGPEMTRLMAMGKLGCPHYLSPDLASMREADARSDLYSLGAILFEMLSGSKPYDADSAAAVVLAHLYEPITSLLELDRDILPQVDELVRKCLAKEPQDRYQTAAELLEAIDAARRALDASGSDTFADLAGQTLGPYRIIGQIGQGGMSTVYKAYEAALDRYVAIKVLSQALGHGPEFAIRFEREAKAVA